MLFSSSIRHWAIRGCDEHFEVWWVSKDQDESTRPNFPRCALVHAQYGLCQKNALIAASWDRRDQRNEFA